ncbi:hypothetical protein BV22DRAFT_1039758 [Leucogyrophana mollusca]|uniref:Uncharacterized protein n=1 Tax=Leucogyrophana mollusca TaxID=85980 RepID=A0ACB8B5Q9_9AGAM|nr:hypothetical protein BV22DRAFT_1039758 [Leucogyrophana mollusca]
MVSVDIMWSAQNLGSHPRTFIHANQHVAIQSTFHTMSLGPTTYTSISATLLSIFSFSSTPPPYNHWHVGCARDPYENSSEVFISIAPCVAIPVPNGVAYDGARQAARQRTQSFALTELSDPPPADHHSLLKVSQQYGTAPRVRKTSGPKALVAAPVLCDGVDVGMWKMGGLRGSDLPTRASKISPRRSASCS